MKNNDCSCVLRGGLGNCMFIVATVLGYSFKYNIEYCIPSKVESPHYPNQKVFYSKYLKYCTGEDFIAPMYNEKSFEYHEIPAPTGNIILNGYFQSYLYFQDYREEILRVLDIPYEFKDNTCSIHVRRTDYLQLHDIHPVMPMGYFQKAQIKIMNEGCSNFIVVSDDIEWCKNNFPMLFVCKYVFSEGRTEIEDLSLASSCAHNIGSNSSFSFWIYWLNRNINKVGVFPKKDQWFGKNLKHNVDDLYMPEWVLI